MLRAARAALTTTWATFVAVVVSTAKWKPSRFASPENGSLQSETGTPYDSTISADSSLRTSQRELEAMPQTLP